MSLRADHLQPLLTFRSSLFKVLDSLREDLLSSPLVNTSDARLCCSACGAFLVPWRSLLLHEINRLVRIFTISCRSCLSAHQEMGHVVPWADIAAVLSLSSSSSLDFCLVPFSPLLGHIPAGFFASPHRNRWSDLQRLLSSYWAGTLDRIEEFVNDWSEAYPSLESTPSRRQSRPWQTFALNVFPPVAALSWGYHLPRPLFGSTRVDLAFLYCVRFSCAFLPDVFPFPFSYAFSGPPSQGTLFSRHYPGPPQSF